MKNIQAFPIVTKEVTYHGGSGGLVRSVSELNTGMTLLDYFAAHERNDGGINQWEYEKIAEFRYKQAAAMMKEREKYIKERK